MKRVFLSHLLSQRLDYYLELILPIPDSLYAHMCTFAHGMHSYTLTKKETSTAVLFCVQHQSTVDVKS